MALTFAEIEELIATGKALGGSEMEPPILN